MNTKFQDQPTDFPHQGVGGELMKPVTQILLERRATAHFKPDPVPAEYLDAILRFAAQAPSGYNLQPWRFIVVQEKTNRERLQKAAFNQAKIGEAPVVIIAYAIKDDWKNDVDAIFDEGLRRGCGTAESLPTVKKQATEFLEHGIAPAVWLNRQTMIAVTTMMLVAEAYGFDTAPMEGFDPAAVKKGFGLPENAEVIALLAIGRAAEPDKPYGGRLALSETVSAEHFDCHWKGADCGREGNSKISGKLEPIEKIVTA